MCFLSVREMRVVPFNRIATLIDPAIFKRVLGKKVAFVHARH